MHCWTTQFVMLMHSGLDLMQGRDRRYFGALLLGFLRMYDLVAVVV